MTTLGVGVGFGVAGGGVGCAVFVGAAMFALVVVGGFVFALVFVLTGTGTSTVPSGIKILPFGLLGSTICPPGGIYVGAPGGGTPRAQGL